MFTGRKETKGGKESKGDKGGKRSKKEEKNHWDPGQRLLRETYVRANGRWRRCAPG